MQIDKKAERQTARFIFAISDEEKERYTKKASQDDISLSAVIKKLLKKWEAGKIKI